MWSYRVLLWTPTHKRGVQRRAGPFLIRARPPHFPSTIHHHFHPLTHSKDTMQQIYSNAAHMTSFSPRTSVPSLEEDQTAMWSPTTTGRVQQGSGFASDWKAVFSPQQHGTSHIVPETTSFGFGCSPVSTFTPEIREITYLFWVGATVRRLGPYSRALGHTRARRCPRGRSKRLGFHAPGEHAYSAADHRQRIMTLLRPQDFATWTTPTPRTFWSPFCHTRVCSPYLKPSLTLAQQRLCGAQVPCGPELFHLPLTRCLPHTM